MTALALPPGLRPESIARLEEIAHECLRGQLKYSAAHDAALFPRDWYVRIGARVEGGLIGIGLGGNRDPISRELIVEAAALCIAWLEAHDAKPEGRSTAAKDADPA